jgi:hypothetical protein
MLLKLEVLRSKALWPYIDSSFQDIVEDDDIKLDWLFKMSLIRDLVRVRLCLLG